MPGRNSPYHRAPASDSDDYFFSDDTDNGNLLAGPHVLADLAHQDMHSEDRTNLDDIEVYRMRWLTLCLFGFLTLSNAVLFVTFAAMSTTSSVYFGSYGSPIEVDWLATIFLALYAPGTILGVYMQKFGLRKVLLMGGVFSAVGSLLRLLVAVFYSSISAQHTYVSMFLAQAIAALSYPIYVNIVAALASTWFPVHERDTATALASLFNPIGNAIGQILPSLIVSPLSDDDVEQSTGRNDISGMQTLMLIEFLMCLIPLLLSILFLKSAPPSAPSNSTRLKLNSVAESKDGVWHTIHNNNNLSSSSLIDQSRALFRSKNFVILFICFTIILGLLNSLLALFNTILTDNGYTDSQSGTLVAACIVSGLLGASLSGVLMEKTQAYRTIMKVGAGLCFVGSTVLYSVLYPNNFWPILFAMCALGFVALPMLPIMIENCVECTYPVREELSIAWLHNGANAFGVAVVFIVQKLMDVKAIGPAPFLPSSLFIIALFFLCFLVILLYDGKYKRLYKDYPNLLQDKHHANSISSSDSSSLERDHMPHMPHMVVGSNSRK